jgi:hypothetical protein
VHWLARCYLLFPDNGRLVTLRLTSLPSKDKSDPNKVDGEKQLYREVVIYDITKLPDLVVLEQYVIDEPISDPLEALEIASSYSHACLPTTNQIKLVYGTNNFSFRALVLKTAATVRSVPLACDLQTLDHVTSSASAYLMDHCSYFVVLDRDMLTLTIFSLEIICQMVYAH